MNGYNRNLYFNCTRVVDIHLYSYRELLAFTDVGTNSTFLFLLRGHKTHTHMHTHTSLSQGNIHVSHVVFFFSIFPSEISQSDSLERIEANAFDNLLNLSEM